MKEECFGLRKEVEELKEANESLNKELIEKNKAVNKV
jgi:FtsZ-binding cell division protein ZapB